MSTAREQRWASFRQRVNRSGNAATPGTPGTLDVDTAGQRRALLLILGLYVALALVYGVATPILEASDENWHEAAVWQIMAGHGLPILDPNQHGRVLVPVQEAGQPPLYYLLAAAVTFWIHPPNPLDVITASPNAAIGRPDRSTWHKSLFVHGAVDAFPWRGLALAIHVQRLLSTVCGAVTVLAVYGLCRLAAPLRPALALLAAALVAFDPMFLFISASVDNDALAIALSTIILWRLLRTLQQGTAPRDALFTGVLLALAALTKLSAAAIALPVIGVYGYLAWRAGSLRLVGQCAAALIGPSVFLTGWWFLRNWSLYGDPLGLGTFVQVAGGRPKSLTVSGLLAEAPSIWDGFWGVFGVFDILLPAAYYTAARVLLLLAGLGLVMACTEQIRRRQPSVSASSPAQRTPPDAVLSLPPSPMAPPVPSLSNRAGGRALLVLGGWLVLEALLLVYWTSTTEASSGRLLFPAFGSVAFLVALGLVTLAGQWEMLLAGSLGALFALGAALAIPLAIVPAYAAPNFVPVAQLRPAESLGYHFGNLELVGATLPPAPLEPGSIVTVTLYWAALGPIAKNDVISVQLFGPAGVRVEDQQYRSDAFPGGGKVLTTAWPEGMGLADRIPIRLRADIPAPSLVHVVVFVYPDGQTSAPIQARRANGQPISSAEIARLVYGRAAAIVPVAPTSLAVFGRQIVLQSAEVPRTGRAGTALPIVLHWRAITTPSVAYTVFVHLGPVDQPPLAQHDQQPLDGKLPTTDWVAGEAIDDQVQLPLPPSLTAGAYALYTGLYLPSSGARLTLSGGATQVLIGTVTIQPEGG